MTWDHALRDKVDVKLGAGADLEILAEKNGAAAHCGGALAVVDGVGRVGVDECALSDNGVAAIALG
jgi:hypothetical protein